MPTKRSTSVEDFIIDFSKEEQGGGGGRRYKPGTYPSRVIAAKPMTSQDKGTPGLEVTFQFTAGKLKGKKMVDTLWASPKAYSRFRTLLEACGKKVPQRVNLIRIAKAIKGAELYIEIADEEREGYKTRSRVTFDGFISEDDYEADEDADDEDDEAEDEEEDDEDLEDEDEEDEEEEDEEEEEEEEPPAKRRRSRAKAKATTKSTTTKRRKKAPADDDDLDDLDLDAL
jgi:hypothetical protein